MILSNVLSTDYETILIVLFKEGEIIKNLENELGNNRVVFVNGKSYLAKAFYLYIYLYKSKFDAIFCYLPSNNIMGTVIAKLAGVKLIYGGLRGAKIKSARIKMFFQKHILNNLATSIISNSYCAKESYSSYGLNKEKIVVIHNAIHCPENAIIRKKRETVKVLTVGRFVDEKDYETALRAIANIVKSYNNINYIIVGYGEKENQIRSLITDLRIQDSVTIIINPSNLCDYYREADIYLLSSIHEGMPNSIMEAMCYSLPIVATDAGDTKYLVRNGENGYLNNKKDYMGISSNIEKLLNSHFLRLEYGKKSFQIIKSDFSTAKLKDNYEVVLNKHNI